MAADVDNVPKKPSRRPPAGWLPEGARFHVIAIRDRESGCWEAIAPAFSIAGMGETPKDAIENVRQLLRDYLDLCLRDGLTFKQSYRPMGWRWTFSIAGTIIRLWLERRGGPRVRFANAPVPAH